jgi:hypothetical protein
MYYPPNKIKPNQYTTGNEYVIAQNRANYIGYYFTTFDGKIFTGKTIGDTSNLELLPASQFNQSSNDYTVIGDRFYTRVLKGNNEEVQQLPKYSIPRPSLPIPTDDDYKRGFFSRYFMKRVNGDIINEINRETFNDISQGIKHNKALYTTTSLLWQITGQLETTINNGIITRGVKQINFETIQKYSLVFIGIDQYLTDYAEFFKPSS